MKRRMLTIVIAIVLVATMLVGGTVAMAGSSGSANISITRTGSLGPNVHQFTVTNTSAVDYEFDVYDGAGGSIAGASTSSGSWVLAGGGGSTTLTVSYNDNRPHDVGVYILNCAEPTILNDFDYTSTANRYLVAVDYIDQATGARLGGSDAYMELDGRVTFTGEPTLNVNGVGYERVDNYGATLTYGQVGPAVIKYKQIKNDPINVNIRFVDEYNRSIGSINDIKVTYGNALTQNIDSKITYNGKDYTLDAGQPTQISHDYGLGSKTYTIRYTSVPTKAQAFRVVYVDQNGKTLITNTATVQGGSTTDFPTATTYTAANGQTYARVAGEPTMITHAYDGATTMYTVRYEPIKATGEYQIVVKYVDSVTGAQIGDLVYRTVPVNQADRFPFPRTLSVGGKDYVVSNGQGNEVIHTYGEAKRVYTVYYNEQGENAPKSYEVTMRFVNISDGKTPVLNPITKEVTATAPAVFDAAKETIAASESIGGKEYVMLGNQDVYLSKVSHDYYDAQRVYTVYYRDINAPNQAGRIEYGENGERIIYTDEGEVLTETAAGETETAPVEPEDGEDPTEQIPDNPNPEAGTEGDGTEETANPEDIADNPNALSDAAKEANEAAGGWLLWGIIIAAAAVATVLIVVFYRKKKKASDNMNA